MRSMTGTKQRLRCLAVSSTCGLGLPHTISKQAILTQEANEMGERLTSNFTIG